MLKFDNSSIGLDIGTHFIKVVELKRVGTAINLLRFGIKEIPRDPNLDRNKITLQMVSQLFSEVNIKTRRVNISAGGQNVFIRFVKFLQIKEDRLKQTMRFEAQNQIPFPLDEVAWDWSVLDKGKKTVNKAVIVAIKKNLAEEMTSRLKTIKLETSLIDVSSLALYNCVTFNGDYDEKRLSVILDIGAGTTNLIIFKEGNVWVRSFSVGVDRINEAGEQGIEEFIGEIERSLEYFFIQSGEELQTDKRIQDLILTGGGSAITALEVRLLSRFGVQPRRLDPFRKIGLPKGLFSERDIEAVKNQFAVSIGLALRGLAELKIEVNLLKEMLSERAYARQRAIYWRLSIIMAALIVVSFSIFMRQDYNAKRARLEKIDETLNLYKTYEPRIKEVERDIDVLNNKVNMLAQVAISRGVWLDILSKISEIMPKELWVTDISCIISIEEGGPGRLDLNGKALSYQAVNSFVSSLKSSAEFKDVKPISSSVETDSETGEEIVKFSITMEVAIGG